MVLPEGPIVEEVRKVLRILSQEGPPWGVTRRSHELVLEIEREVRGICFVN